MEYSKKELRSHGEKDQLTLYSVAKTLADSSDQRIKQIRS